jgi:hypothetical protein
VREALTLCHEIAAAKLQILQAHRQWQNAILQRGLAEGVRQIAKGTPDRIAQAKRTPSGDLENHVKRSQSQLSDIEGELKAGESRMVTTQREQARTLQQVQTTVAGLLSHLDKSPKGDVPASKSYWADCGPSGTSGSNSRKAASCAGNAYLYAATKSESTSRS